MTQEKIQCPGCEKKLAAANLFQHCYDTHPTMPVSALHAIADRSKRAEELKAEISDLRTAQERKMAELADITK